MSHELFDAARTCDCSAQIPMTVLYQLAGRANKEGKAWPSIATLMADCRLSRSSVQRALKYLEDHGHITRLSRDGKSSLWDVHPRQSDTRVTQTPVSHRHMGGVPQTWGVGQTDLGGVSVRHPEPSENHQLSLIEPPSPPKPPEGGDAKANGVKATTGYTDDFERFWQAWPRFRRERKVAAFKAWKKVIKTTDPEHVIERAGAYCRVVSKWDKKDRQFVPHPSTWLNDGGYDDEPDAWSRYADPVDPLEAAHQRFLNPTSFYD